MSRERDAIELIWEWLNKNRPSYIDSTYLHYYGWLEQILTQMEDMIQEDLEQMESSCRSREVPKSKTEGEWNRARFFGHYCPLIEEYKKSQEATNTQTFWGGVNVPATSFTPLKPGDLPAEGDTYSPV